MMKTIRFWTFVGASEILLVVILAAIAPTFFNSALPIIGFLIWVAIVTLILSSVGYLIYRWHDAYRARRLFIQAFPDYQYLGVVAFLDRSSTRVANTIELWHDIQDDPEFIHLGMSPLEFLRGVKK